jgi:hypothetical protein
MQNLVALFIVAVAAGYLVRRGWRFFAARKSAGCGNGCGSCPASGDATVVTKPIVTIEALQKH